MSIDFKSFVILCFKMFRHPVCLSALLLLLPSCERNIDHFPPRIVITHPEGRGASQTRSLIVKGYVLDDVGISKITVDGQPVQIKPGSRKIARFEFQATIEGQKDEFKIRAVDQSGHESTLPLPVSIDKIKPKLSLKSFERVGNTVRVSGVATDNLMVSQILIDGGRLNIKPGKRVEFFAETKGVYADVKVLDSALNAVMIRAKK